MILSIRRKFIFLHMPKCAGTSVEAAYLMNKLDTDIILTDMINMWPGLYNEYQQEPAVKLAFSKLSEGSNLLLISKFLRTINEDINDYKIGMIVRNPWDRVVSYFNWLNTLEMPQIQKNIMHVDSFNDFVCEIICKVQNQTYKNFLTINNEIKDDLIVEFNTLDFSEVNDYLGFDLNIPILNKTKYKSTNIKFTNKTKDLIANQYKWIINRQKYKFEY